MTLEIGLAIAAMLLLGVATPVARRAVKNRDPHAILALVAFCTAYAILVAIFLVDIIAQQSLPPTLRFARGFAAGVAVGLLISSGALWIYDYVTRGATYRRKPSPT